MTEIEMPDTEGHDRRKEEHNPMDKLSGESTNPTNKKHYMKARPENKKNRDNSPMGITCKDEEPVKAPWKTLTSPGPNIR